MIDLTRWRDGDVVICIKNQAEYDMVARELDANGYKWGSGDSLMKMSYQIYDNDYLLLHPHFTNHKVYYSRCDNLDDVNDREEHVLSAMEFIHSGTSLNLDMGDLMRFL